MRPGWSCATTPHGSTIAASAERASRLAALATEGERRFRLRFGRDAPPYTVVELDGDAVDIRLDTALKDRGVRWRLPWLSEGAMAAGFRSSITRAVTAKAAAMHLDDTRTAALVEATLAQQTAKLTPEALRAREAGALPHELGHGWFVKAFWPEAATRAGDHYGGPAPDWMDETAAVLMEDDALADSRRRQFRAIHDGADAAARKRLVDLAVFLSGSHPALPAMDVGSGSGSGAPAVRVLTGDEAARIAAVAGTFYLQARLFADYVLARSGDPAAFRTAADAFATGRTTAQWLGAAGPRLHLPVAAAALQADWDAWLAAPRS